MGAPHPPGSVAAHTSSTTTGGSRPDRAGSAPLRLGAATGVRQNEPMSLSVDESWDRISRWLDRYAPAVAGVVGPPASTQEIAAVADGLGVPVPADLAAWWRRAN